MAFAFAPVSRLVLASAFVLAGAAPTLASPAYLKIGDIKGESTDKGHEGQIEVISFTFSPVRSTYVPQGDSSERDASAGTWTVRKSGENGAGVATSDPQEGGEIVAKEPGKIGFPDATRSANASVGEIPIVKHPDSSTSKLLVAHAAPAAPPESGSLTVEIPAGTCVSGASYPVVSLTSGAKLYRLQDVTVTGCGPIIAAKGKKKQQVKLDYLKVEMKDVLVTGY